MSPQARKSNSNKRPSPALLFAALGDDTRLALVARLLSGEPASIAHLASRMPLTRQAVTKHLRVLERAGVVHSVRCGRESQFVLDPRPLHALRQYLDRVSNQWDQPLARLKSFVER
jgi:DNA-binding transcriptional ArsR family regulator